MGGPRSKLDAGQVLPHSFDDENNALRFVDASALVPTGYNEINLTYDINGNVETVTYKKDSVTVAVLTLGYDGSSNLTSVVRS